jgi:hypothetical protein
LQAGGIIETSNTFLCPEKSAASPDLLKDRPELRMQWNPEALVGLFLPDGNGLIGEVLFLHVQAIALALSGIECNGSCPSETGLGILAMMENLLPRPWLVAIAPREFFYVFARVGVGIVEWDAEADQ